MSGRGTSIGFPLIWERDEPLVRGVLVKRYQRFLADVRLDGGSAVTAHCVNTGAMEGLTQPGTVVWLSRSRAAHRKLAYTWELAEVEGQIIGVNTSVPNRIVGRLLRERRIPGLAAWRDLAAERKYGERSRIDFHLRTPRGEVFVEVKNCHLRYPDGRAYFPDCVSERGARHLGELAHLVGPGRRAEVIFVVQVPGVVAVRPSDVHDPALARAAREAGRAGVRFRGIQIAQTPEATLVERLIPVELCPYRLEPVRAWREESGRR